MADRPDLLQSDRPTRGREYTEPLKKILWCHTEDIGVGLLYSEIVVLFRSVITLLLSAPLRRLYTKLTRDLSLPT
jgi:hypothetical protein